MIVINILLALLLLFLLFGMIGEKDNYRSRNYTAAFVAVAILIAVLNR